MSDAVVRDIAALLERAGVGDTGYGNAMNVAHTVRAVAPHRRLKKGSPEFRAAYVRAASHSVLQNGKHCGGRFCRWPLPAL